MTISSRVKLLAYNILEEGSVAVTGEDSGYPKARLYDRSLGFYFKYTAAAADVTVSGNSLAVDTLIVEGHNLNGISCSWSYSSNGSSWTAAHSWTQSGNGQILKQLTSPLTYAYWKFSISSASYFQATEIFMGRAFSVPVIWENNPAFRYVDDVEWIRTYGGVDHSIRIGPKRRHRQYVMFMDRSSFPIASFRSDLEYLDDFTKPLYIIDHEDNCFLAKFDGGLPEEEHINEGLLTINCSLLEIPS